MTDRPILFSAPMVRALLDGSKTQTRRIVKLPPEIAPEDGDHSAVTVEHVDGWQGLGFYGYLPEMPEEGSVKMPCPHGQPGDRLWVRERFTQCASTKKSYAVFPDGGQKYDDGGYFPGLKEYAAGAFDHIKWKPSIHMPRWASRITLEIIGVRVERLQDISEEDARSEGAEAIEDGELMPDGSGGREWSRRLGYMRLWDVINGVGSWGLNPWVWVLTFRRVKP